MKNFTRIVGIIAMVAVMALAVSCSKNETSSGNGGSTETATAAAKSGDGLAGTVWETTFDDGTVAKYTFAETDSMVLVQRSDGGTYQGFYKVFGDTVMFTWDNGSEVEYTRSGDTMTSTYGTTYTKVK